MPSLGTQADAASNGIWKRVRRHLMNHHPTWALVVAVGALFAGLRSAGASPVPVLLALSVVGLIVGAAAVGEARCSPADSTIGSAVRSGSRPVAHWTH